MIVTLTATAQTGLATLGNPNALVPGVLYDTVIAMFIGPLAVTLHDRRAVTERAEW